MPPELQYQIERGAILNGSMPPLRKPLYNQTLAGVYGEMASGAGAQVFFLQSTLRPTDLSKITLISDIRGSEKWQVRDLFQREVDVRRVTHGLLPYFQDQAKVKFFNPLTLTVLPMDPETDEVLDALPEMPGVVTSEEGAEWRTWEFKGFYQFRVVKDQDWGQFQWNDSRAKLVAIDGQHRLSALKRYWSDGKKAEGYTDFLKWSIPVVIVSFRSPEDGRKHQNILEVVRSIFIYINSEARIPNRARRILLTDESINSICTQELLQVSHTNDLLEPGDRDGTAVPLLFYDWRGEEVNEQKVSAPAAVKEMEEVSDWFEFYILGKDFSTEQETALGVQPIEPLKTAFQERRLTVELARALRSTVRERLLPGIRHILENFLPYRDYIGRLRKLESEYNDASDVARHAFDMVRFGMNRAGEDVQKDINLLKDELITKIEELKLGMLYPPVDHVVGMRGIVSSYGELRREYYQKAVGRSVSWLEYSEWFTRGLNQAYGDGWIDTRDKARKRGLLLHIVHDHNETVVNYRLEAAENALGAFMALVVAAHGRIVTSSGEKAWVDLEERVLSERLSPTILRGYKKQVRPLLREQYPAGGTALTEAVRREAEQRTSRHIKKIGRALDAVGR